MKSVGARLLHIRADTSQTEFARQMGVSLRTYWNYEQDKRPPPAEVLRALAGLGWNPTWVLTGEGDEKLAPDADREAAADFAGAVAGDPDAQERWATRRDTATKAFGRGARAALEGYPEDLSDYVFVPHLSVSAAAGHGKVIDSEQIVAWMAFRKSYLQMLGVPARAACLIRVRGDSMYPDLREGDTVLVDTTDVIVSARPRIYVMRYPGTTDLVVKRVVRDANGAWQISGGDHWPASVIPEGQERPLVIGRVRWSGRTWD